MLVRHLTDLLAATGLGSRYLDLEISGISADSSKVKKGYAFFALKGEKSDGAQFVSQAEENGAVVSFVGKDSVMSNHQHAVIVVDNPRILLSKMAAAFYGRQPEHVVAVTGTDGKTSTADFFRQFMYLAGAKSASMGTIGVISGDGKNLAEGTLTTPSPVELHKLLSELAETGVEHLAMEASSHGLSQYRLDGVCLHAAAFTNIARDHLDYHKTEEAYFLAKARLFADLLPEGRIAVLNQDDAKFSRLNMMCAQRNHRVIGFGRGGEAFTIRSIANKPHGQSVDLRVLGRDYRVEVPLVGEFQVMNILAALGLVMGVDGDIHAALEHIPQLKGVSGRLEMVATTKQGAAIFVDYAHTPLALAKILTTLRPHTQGKLVVVFGCGGDRDAGKRPLMGKIASELADVAIITDDNPRSEDPQLIRRAILAGCIKPCKEVADRAEAIYLAACELNKGDILVVAGKGHEKMQIIGDKQLPFDDAEIARIAVSK